MEQNANKGEEWRRAVRRIAIGLACFGAIAAESAVAQVGAVNAVEVQRQQERERALREQQETSPDVRLQAKPSVPAARLPEGESPCFPIRDITLKSDTPEFDWARDAANIEGDPAIGRCLGTEGINQVMKRVQDAIVARGYVTTRVVAEAQDLNSGRLTLTVLPGRIRVIRFSPESDSRANAWNAMPARPGDILNLRGIEQGLENFKRVPTAEADIQIVPGEAPGESDLVITWKQAFPLRLTVNANDGGSKSTGKYLGSVTVSGDHLLMLNDLFYASFTHDLGGGAAGNRGTQGHTLHYSLPYDYWLFGVTANENRYHQTVAGATQNYLYSGTSENYEAKLTRVIFRDGSGKTSASLRGYLTKSSNFIDDTEVEVQRRRMAGWEAGLQHRAFIADAVLDLAGAYRHGTGAFGALSAPEDAFNEGASRPQLFTAEVSFNQPFKLGSERFRYNGSWRAQWNRTPLVTLDRFSIGGRYTVRGFDGENVLMAERGWLIRNDLGWSPGDSSQELYLGIDHGQVGGQSASLLVGTRLTGAVVGLRGGYKDFSWDAFTGCPLAKPEGFKTAHNTSGINLTWNF